ncbi:transposase [Streptomyces sp. NPDC101151]|uniref:transposase n=1 Tax=Streptomyces sp. NPDC101151 TaxID=3366115 RepID=UPI0037F73192
MCQDPTSTYTGAIKEAAPNATEVADRWRLLRNVSHAVGQVCNQHCTCLRKYAEHQQRTQTRQSTLDLLPATLISSGHPGGGSPLSPGQPQAVRRACPPGRRQRGAGGG